MKTYRIEFTKPAMKAFQALPKVMQLPIDEHIRALAENPFPHGCVKLKGTQNAYRIRIGDYRVLYRVEEERVIIVVFSVAHRKEVYRHL